MVTVRAAEAPGIDIVRMEKAVHGIINEERVRRGTPEMKWSDPLAEAARSHSRYLAGLNGGKKGDLQLSHDGPTGDHSTRLHQAGFYAFSASGENIFGIHRVRMFRKEGRVSRPVSLYGEEEMALKARDGWMRSPGHRKNILDGEFDESGVGIATDPTGRVFIFTQVFIRRARCGYVTGPCCEQEGYLPHCYVPHVCRGGLCH